jgi:hypothetical protein
VSFIQPNTLNATHHRIAFYEREMIKVSGSKSKLLKGSCLFELLDWTPSVIGRLGARGCEDPASGVMLLFVMCAMALT